MHASISHLRGDPDDLLRRYDAMLGAIGSENLLLHLCLRAPDGIVVVDTCPSKAAFEAFHTGDAFPALRAAYGLPDPDRLEDFPVHAAFAAGDGIGAQTG